MKPYFIHIKQIIKSHLSIISFILILILFNILLINITSYSEPKLTDNNNVEDEQNKIKEDYVKVYDKYFEIPIGSILQRPIGLQNFRILDLKIYHLDISFDPPIEHFGVYIGNNKVIHYNSVGYCDKSTAVILIDTVEDFVCGKYGKKYYIKIKHTPKNKNQADAIVNEAIRILRAKNDPKFDLVFRNCESFVEYCYELPFKSGNQIIKKDYGLTQVDNTAIHIINLESIFDNMHICAHIKPFFYFYKRIRLKDWEKLY